MRTVTKLLLCYAILHWNEQITVHCNVTAVPPRSESRNPYEPFMDLIHDLISTTLAGEDVFFLLDSKLSQYLDLDILLREGNRHLNSHLLIFWDEIQGVNSTLPEYYIRGENMIMFAIFFSNPFQYIEKNENLVNWNPDFILLLNINLDENATDVINHDFVQRSMSITYLKYEPERNLFSVNKITHRRPGINETNVQSIFVAFYDKLEFSNRSSLVMKSRINLSGSKLYLASWCDDLPFIILAKDGTCIGVSIELMSIVAKILNFSFDIQIQSPDGMWGSKKNGTWTGMLADLLYHGKHIVINYLLLTEDRFTDFDTTYPYFSEGFGFALKEPPPIPKWLGLVHPFTRFVWISFICSTILVAILFTTVLYNVQDSQPFDTSFLLVCS